jgi:hypothetical protein
MICSSPWEYKHLFRNDDTLDMVPRIHYHPQLEITYLGRRRNTPRKWIFEQDRAVDVMDLKGCWWEAHMVACQDNRIQYHFKGWSSQWDEWFPDTSLHVAPLHSVTRDWRSTLQKGDKVDIERGYGEERSWFCGVVHTIRGPRVWVKYNKKMDCEVVELSSDRLMFRGAHTSYDERHTLLPNTVVWRTDKGCTDDGTGSDSDIYQYRIKNGFTILVDHLLSEKEEDEFLDFKKAINIYS